MASITGILLLFFDAKTAFEMMFMLGRNPKYNMCGYWREKAVKQAVQTMPIKYLIDFWTQFFEKGFKYLFKYILSLLMTLSPLLLSVDIDYKLMGMLRCDRKTRFWKCINNGNDKLEVNKGVSMFFEQVLNDIKLIDTYCDFDKLDFQKEREYAFNNYLCDSLLNGAVGVTFAQFEIESGNDSDDEPKDCIQCDDGCADIFCNECEVYLCDCCHKKALGDHILTHSIKQLYDY
eukprot:524297_1